MGKDDALFAKVRPGERIPVELCKDIKIDRYVPGEGSLTFPPDPRYPDADGNPRRLEWVREASTAQMLTGPKFNRNGRDEIFRIANDLLEQDQISNLQGKLRQAAADLIDDAVSELTRRVDEQSEINDKAATAIEGLINQIVDLTTQLGELDKRITKVEKPQARHQEAVGGRER